MNIVEEYGPEYKTAQMIKVLKAEYTGNFKVALYFADGLEKTVDFKPFLTKSNHPDIKKYLDEKEFMSFQIIHGNLNWNDYEMIFPIADLYEGKI